MNPESRFKKINDLTFKQKSKGDKRPVDFFLFTLERSISYYL